VTVVVRHRCPDAATARALRAAVAADNPPYVSLEVEGSEMVVRLTTASAASARATLEDLLACLSAAERSLPPPADGG
jgi:hypothetical protein